MMKAIFQINHSLAQMIVDAAKEVIEKDINFIQLDGKIIASTDPKRIGFFHKVSLQVKEKGTMVKIYRDNKLEGIKKGINYPIVIDGQMLGVIGVSGPPEECESLGFLLTKITEVLIKEQMLSIKTHSLDELRSAIVRMLIFENDKKHTLLNEHFHQLECELEENAFVSIIHLHKLNNPSEFTTMHNILLKQEIKLFTYLFPNKYVIIVNESQYKTVINRLVSYLQSIQIKFSMGVGSITPLENLCASYNKARISLKYANLKQIYICEYAKLDLEIVLENIDSCIRDEYIKKLIGELTEEEITLLQTYYKYNLSLKQTAETLFIYNIVWTELLKKQR
ncbi:CdaR family transcriptional regulator [Priestia megaterium]